MKKYKKIFLAFVLLWLTGFYNCVAFHHIKFQYGDSLIGFYFLYFFIANRRKLPQKTLFGREIVILILTTFASLIPNIFILQQSAPIVSIRMLLYCIPMMYFWLKINKFTSKDLLDVVLPIGFVYCCILIFQQIIHPNILFSVPTKMDPDNRSGFWRYIIVGLELAIFFCYYSVNSYIETKKKKALFYSIIGLITIFLSLYRTIWVECIIALILLYVRKGLNRFNTWFKLCIIGLSLTFVISHLAFFVGKDMIEMTENHISSDDYIRYTAYNYYFTESVSNPIFFLFGHGLHVGVDTNSYAKMIQQIQEDYGLWISDIGIIGQLYLFGSINVLVLMLLVIKMIKKSVHIRYVFAILVSRTIFWFIVPIYYGNMTLLILTISMYLIDCYWDKNHNNIIYNRL